VKRWARFIPQRSGPTTKKCVGFRVCGAARSACGENRKYG
jgi:hypothetical protein